MLAPAVGAPPIPVVASRDRGLLTLLAATIAALLLIPDRYNVPLVAGLGLRPYQLLAVGLGIGLLRSFAGGRRLSVGRPALFAGLLVIVAVASAIDNFDRLGDTAYLAAIRLIVT